MKSKLFLFMVIIVGVLIFGGCVIKPGESVLGDANFAGQAIGVACTSDDDCGRGKSCYRGRCWDGSQEEERSAEREERFEEERGERDEALSEERSEDYVVEEVTGYGGSQCIDSDGGKNFLVKGKVEVAGEVKEDYCHTFKDGSVYLFEAICGSDAIGNDPQYYVQKKCEEPFTGVAVNTMKCGEGVCKTPVTETCLDYIDAATNGKKKILFEGTEYETAFGFSNDFGQYGFNIFAPNENIQLNEDPLVINEEREIKGKNTWVFAKVKYIDGKLAGTICFSTQPKKIEEKALELCKQEGFNSICTKEKIIPCDAGCSIQALWDINLNYKTCVMGCLLKEAEPSLSTVDAEQCYTNGCTYDSLKNNICDLNCASYECKYDLQKCSVPTADYTKVQGQEVTLKTGQSYTLENNIQIKVTEIINYESLEGQKLNEEQQFIVIEVTHEIKGDNLFLFPTSLILAKSAKSTDLTKAVEYAGYRIEYKKYNFQDNSVSVIFYPLTKKLSSTHELFTECKKYRSFVDCHILSYFNPLNDEVKLETTQFNIVGQKTIEPYLKYVQDEVESCYAFDKNILGLELKKKKFPIRVRSDHYNVNQVNIYGMWLYINPKAAVDPKYVQKINGKCDDGLIAHEIVHTIFQDKYTTYTLPLVLNEGLATYITNKVDPIFACQETGILFKDGTKRSFYPLNKYGIWPFSTADGKPTSNDLYTDAACLFAELEKDLGKEKFAVLLKAFYSPKQYGFIEILQAENINPIKYENKYSIDNSYVFLFQKPMGITKGKWDASPYKE